MQAPDAAASPDTDKLEELQSRLKVRFKNLELLGRAVTHRSAAVEAPHLSNERLEFLGDSVIGVLVCEQLYKRFPEYSEGELAKSRAYIVSEHSLARAALALGLQDFIVMVPRVVTPAGRLRPSILSDAFEAIVGAIYLDQGYVQARGFVRAALNGIITESAADSNRGDYKSSLQERIQALFRTTPIYRVVQETGQEHDKTFAVEALLHDEVIGAGSGKTKKEAEQSAAQDALLRLSFELTPGLE